MKELKNNFGEIKDSNLVFFVEKESDLKLIKDLKLDKKIIDKIKEVILKGENKTIDFFIGNEAFEKLIIIYYSLDSKKDINYFLGAEFPKLPNNLTILTNNDKNINILLNNSLLSRYKYQEYKSEKQNDEIFFIVNDKNKDIFKHRLKTIKNILLARDLGFKPSNELYPETFAKLIKENKFKNTKVKIFDFKDIQKKKLGLLEAVGKGSAKKPYMIVFERIIDKSLPTIGIVGKGITFDTGGIQVKPGDNMYEMKGDMCGAAATFATIKELDEAELKVNIVACIVLAENHISGESYKPSDIITSYSGKTVDIIHTDAEGRLVLADGVSYISKNYKLNKIVTIATLTGACMVALGYRYAGIMGNDEDLISRFLDYSKTNFEKYNRLPFDDYFIEKTRSKIADLENLNRAVFAGSTMGAAFLSNFVLNGEAYTHLDIAGTALNSYEPYGYANQGMTGFGVDSLSTIIKNLK
ncbi:MAG: leucyl aminopeptidase family protein [Candidatus Gracilibacteria bacterium]|nr:leucyl aminopeptidase family protein [Candidatus Gracilibacteria bacterium]